MGAAKAVWKKTTASHAALTIAPEAGDFLIAGSTTDIGAGTVTVPSGWTQIGTTLYTSAVDAASTAYFYKRADGTETSVTFAWTSENNSLDVVASYADINVDDPFDVAAVIAANNTATEQVDMSITPVTDGSTIVFFVACDGPSGTYTWNYSTVSGTTGDWASPNEVAVTNGYFNIGMNDCVQETAGAITARCVAYDGTNGCSHPAVLIALRRSGTKYTEGVSDSVSASDSVSLAQVFNVPLNDGYSILEYVGIVAGAFQRNAFQINAFQVFDDQGGGALYEEALNESISLSDGNSLSSVLSSILALSDSHTSTDNNTLSSILYTILAVSDSHSISSEDLTYLLRFPVLLEDSKSTSDSLSSILNTTIGVNEATSSNEALDAIIRGIIALEDSKSHSDSITSFYKSIFSVSEATGVSDELSLLRFIASVGLPDAISIVEELTSQGRSLVDIADSLNIEESQAAGLLLTALINETVNSNEGIGSFFKAIQALSDTTYISDSINTGGTTTYDTPLYDEIGVSDGLLAGLYSLVSLTDSSSIQEALAYAIRMVVTLSDQTGLDEASTSKLTAIFGLADSISKNDNLSANMVANLALAEVLYIAEEALAQGKSLISVIDSVDLNENQTAGIVLATALIDTVSHSDSLTSQAKFNELSLQELYSLLDSIAVGGSTTYSIGLSDGHSILDATSIQFRGIAGVSDSITITNESIQYAITMLVALYDDVGLTEQQAVQAINILTVLDSLTISDSTSNSIKYTVSPSDSIGSSETILNNIIANVTVIDAIENLDSVIISLKAFEQLSDEVTDIAIILTGSDISAKVLIQGQWHNIMDMQVLKNGQWHKITLGSVLVGDQWHKLV